LESGALPIEPLAYTACRLILSLQPAGMFVNLLCFAMHGVFAAARAVFFQFHPIRIIAAILLGRVIPFLAI
jgi:hypothetical protein